MNGYVILISHGKPTQRIKAFKYFLESNPKSEEDMKNENLKYSYDFEFLKVELSRLSQLINILRVKLKDQPLSAALKNPALFMEAIEEGKSCTN